MIADHVVVGMFAENSWIAGCEETGEAILIDPGAEPGRIVSLVDRHGLTPVRIVNTHAHLDHVGAVEDMRQKYGIPFALHPGERENLESLADHAAWFGLPSPDEPEVDQWLEEGDVVTFGECSLTVLATPGHTEGGVSLYGHGELFAGDTLFSAGIGRTDLPGGDFRTLYRSIREVLFALPDETRVHCGHGPDTTIGREKVSNPYVSDGADARFTELF
jgi:glyoxylase-like metal-dependent hydrolase (beta-lactamase superfamily II)